MKTINKILSIIISIYMIFNLNIKPAKSSIQIDYLTTMKQDLLVLMLSYPEYIVDIEKDSNNNIYCVMKDHSKILYDDKQKKTFEEKCNNSDLQDTLEVNYPLHSIDKLMDKSINPGRVRNYDLLKIVYGTSKNATEKNLVNLKYYSGYQFNINNKASEELDNAFKDLITLSKTNSKISNFIYPCSGTYNYRLISGTNRLSPHSFGIAIDLKSDSRDYWKWSSRENGEKRIKEYPKELIETFENHNFIWGGKWGYFDILHFEYRPEIILKSKLFSSYDINKPWYTGASLEDSNTEKYITIIEKALE